MFDSTQQIQLHGHGRSNLWNVLGELSRWDGGESQCDGSAAFDIWRLVGACSGTQACSVTMNSSQSVTASFVPPVQTVTLQYTPGTNQTQMATFDCPSNPNPTPANPCTDPNAHAIAFTLPQVNTAFPLTVKVTELPPDVANGIARLEIRRRRISIAGLNRSSRIRPTRRRYGSAAVLSRTPTGTAWCIRFIRGRLGRNRRSIVLHWASELDGDLQRRHVCAAGAVGRQHAASCTKIPIRSYCPIRLTARIAARRC